LQTGHAASQTEALVSRTDLFIRTTTCSASDAGQAARETEVLVSETTAPAREAGHRPPYILLPKSTGPAAKTAPVSALSFEGERGARRASKPTPSGAGAIPAALTRKGASLMQRNTTQRLAFLNLLIAGIGKYFAGVTTLTLAGTAYAPSALVKLLEELVSAINAAVAARTAAHDAVLAASAKSAAVDPVIAALRSYLLGVYSDAKTLADFGLAPRKPRRAPTQQEGAAAAAKRLATRAARHTLGKRQKASVHGTAPEPAPVVAPPPAPAVTPPKV
jgi:hypothetical protein